MRLVGCVRVSRVAGREGDSFISPQQQRDRIQTHAVGNGHRIVAWMEDLDQPGTRMDRPGLTAALEMVERGEADGIAVAKLDRFARSVAGAAKTLERLERAGGELVAVDLGMDTSTPAGKLMRNVLMALAEFEVDRIRENWADAGRRAIARGIHSGPVAPFGYQRQNDGRLEPDPAAAPLVVRVFELRAAGEPWHKLAAMLDQEAPKDGAWPWTTVQNMVRRRTYLGEAFSGEQVNEDGHEPLVSHELWDRAQRLNPRLPVRGGNALLAGLIRCAACGYRLTRQSDGKRGYINYNCRKRHGGGLCPKPARISALRADEHVTAAYLALMGARGISDRERTDTNLAAIAQMKTAAAELAAYRDANLVTVLGPAAYREGLEARAAILEHAQIAIAKTARRGFTLVGHTNLAEQWENVGQTDRRELLAAAIDAVFVKQAHLGGRAPFAHRIHICWAGTGPDNLPGRYLNELAPFSFPVEHPFPVREPPAHHP